MKDSSRLVDTIVGVIASGFGLMIAAVDVRAPFGDDSAQFTVFLWLVTCGLLGFAVPRRPWLWAILVGPWVPFTYLVLLRSGVLRPAKPIDATDFILIPACLVVCLVGAYAGALARRAILPPSSSRDTLPGASA
ncbi:MAG TPA: hypothetical protein VGZ22_13860 [Isosphaeraceae bacterium]|jgi:hypothetical protein|nr:hypothetical protein [Isosphaeraceae bacterium]